MRKLTQEQFIKKAELVHEDKYDYSRTVYVGGKSKVEIICPKHGVFLQQPDAHIWNRSGCPVCANKTRRLYSTDKFITKARARHKNFYDYSKVVYKRNNVKVTIICPIHGEFQQAPHPHLVGQGCPRCARQRTVAGRFLGKDEFIRRAKEVHGNSYRYDKVNYCGVFTPVTISCLYHGDFKQTPHNHTYGERGCPVCVQSRGEHKIDLWLKDSGILFKRQYTLMGCKDKGLLRFDFAVFTDSNKLKCLIEYQGEQHFTPVDYYGGQKAFDNQQRRDKIKRDFCFKNKVVLHQITYKNYENIGSILEQFLGG